MRQKRVTGDKQKMQGTLKKEPLTEGIQKKKKRRPQNFFTKMSDNELVNYAKKFIKENGITTQANLKKVDGSLCQILRDRKLIHIVISPIRKLRSWKSMSDEEFIQFAKDFIAKNDIKNRNNLNMADSGLYYALIRRNLLTAVIPNKQKQGSHDILSDEELIKSAKKFIEEKGIESRSDFQKVGSGLYGTLTRRNLLDIVISSKRKIRDRGFFTNMHDEELVEFAKSFVKEKKIKARSELEKADGGLYQVLRKRNLIEQVIPEKYGRDWSSMTNKEILEIAKKFIEEKNIKTRKDLEKADLGLINILRKRKLLGQVIPEKYGRDWKSLSDKAIIRFAKKFVKENEIKSRKELINLDQSLYQILRRRNLLNAVFSDIEEAKKTEAVKQVVDAMKEFGGSE